MEKDEKRLGITVLIYYFTFSYRIYVLLWARPYAMAYGVQQEQTRGSSFFIKCERVRKPVYPNLQDG